MTRTEYRAGHFSYPRPGLEKWGIDPHTSRMRNERSTIWATSPGPTQYTDGEKITADLSDERLDFETLAELRKLLEFYYTPAARLIAEDWFRDIK